MTICFKVKDCLPIAAIRKESTMICACVAKEIFCINRELSKTIRAKEFFLSPIINAFDVEQRITPITMQIMFGG